MIDLLSYQQEEAGEPSVSVNEDNEGTSDEYMVCVCMYMYMYICMHACMCECVFARVGVCV